MLTFQHCLRVANRVRDALAFHARHWTPIWNGHWPQLDRFLQTLKGSRRQIELARHRGWDAVLLRRYDEQFACLTGLQKLLQEIRDGFPPSPPSAPGLAVLIAEIRHLDHEFGESAIDWNDACLAVETESIELEGVHLGPFSIRLYWERLKEQVGVECFDVVARNPYPASVNEDYTHPHVNDHRLCAGEASDSIARALMDGRLMDAFLLVRNVLRTYNPRSAYAQLESWEGSSCSDCGQVNDEDELRICNRCESDYCSYCISDCTSCFEALCESCSTRCSFCEEACCQNCLHPTSSGPCCRSCLRSCAQCGGKVAKQDRDSSGNCPDCQTVESEPEENPETQKEVPYEVA